MKYLISILIFLTTFASEPQRDELTIAPNVSPLLRELVVELYLNSKINQEYITNFGKQVRPPLDNDFIEITILNNVLKMKLTKQYEHVDISQSLFNELQKNINEISDKMPFSKDIARRVLKDIGELLTTRTLREYNTYVKNRDAKVSAKLKDFMNRITYLQYWIDTLRKPQAIREMTLLESNLEILNQVYKNLTISARTADKSTKISYISIKDVDLIKARQEVDKLFFNSTPEKNPDYEPPKDLPRPVDTWE